MGFLTDGNAIIKRVCICSAVITPICIYDTDLELLVLMITGDCSFSDVKSPDAMTFW